MSQGKTVVISGATRGLGLALSREFARQGWFIYGCGRNSQRVAETQDEFGLTGQFTVVNVADSTQVQQWAANIPTSPQFVIANAGVIHAPCPAWELTEGDFQQLLEVNVVGVFHLARAFIPRLNTAGGIFVGLSSEWGRHAASGMAAYCASKFAVEGFLKALALDFPTNVRVYPLDPGGGIDTDMLRASFPTEARISPSPEQWAAMAYPYLVDALLNVKSGTSVTIKEGK